MVICKRTNLDNVLTFEPFIHRDFRGDYVELFHQADYKKAIKDATGEDVEFVQENISTSIQHVLRGIHGDPKTWKLIDCLKGSIYVAIVDCRKGSTFGKWQSFDLDERNRKQVLVPPMFGTSHLVMSDMAIFHYKQSTFYDPKNLKQFTYRFDDTNFNIWWPIKNPILSPRDETTVNPNQE